MGEERDKRPGEAPGAGLGETRVSHGPNVRATLPLGARSAGAGAGAAGHAIDEATEDTLLAIEVATSTAAGRTIHTQAGSADDTQRWVVDDPLAADADETLRWVVDDPRAMESDDTQLLVVDDTRSLESDDTELLAVGRAARWTVEELADERRGPAAASGQIGETGGGAGLRGAMTRVSVGRFARSNDETRLRSASGFVDEPPDEEPGEPQAASVRTRAYARRSMRPYTPNDGPLGRTCPPGQVAGPRRRSMKSSMAAPIST